MKPLKVNWQSDLLSPGFLLISALLITDLSFLYYQCASLIQISVCIVIALYFSFLLLYKYRSLGWFVGILLTISLLVVTIDTNQSNFELTAKSELKLYPDQIRVSENWITGYAKTESEKLLVSATLNKDQIRLLNLDHTILLKDIQGTISPIPPATNYGQFDACKYYQSQKVVRQLKITNCKVVSKPGGVLDFFHLIRFMVQSYFKSMPRLLAFFSSELILGENSDQDNQPILNNYRDLGIIHILSISGLHVGIYTIIICTICYYLKLTEKEAFICCLVILIIGIFLSNGQAGFIRASLTYILGQLFKFKKIRIAKPDLLGLTCLLHLILNPRLMMSVGALFSYVLALGIEITNKMPSFKQSLALNGLLVPLLLFYFFQFNFLTVVFNALIVPYFNWIVMPVTFLNLISFKVYPNFAYFLEAVLQIGEKLIGQISVTKAGLLTFGKINWWQCTLLITLTAILLICLNEQFFKKCERYKFISILFLLYLFLFISIHFPVNGQVTFIDVGQGDSILVTTPILRQVYLIDVGGKINFSGKKLTPQVNKVTLPLLKAQGISRIDGIFVTHQDADHVGDLGPLLEQIKVKKLYTASGLIKNPSFVKRIAGRIKKEQVVELLAGERVSEPQIKFDVVYPFQPGLGKNEDSLSLTFRLANKRWLFTGDLNQAGEKDIMAKYGLQADYFKLGHHGSRTASNPDFLKKLNPKLVFISAGRNNRFGHPHPETLDTLITQHIPWASTQDCGMITWSYSKLTKPKFKCFIGD